MVLCIFFKNYYVYKFITYKNAINNYFKITITIHIYFYYYFQMYYIMYQIL